MGRQVLFFRSLCVGTLFWNFKVLGLGDICGVVGYCMVGDM